MSFVLIFIGQRWPKTGYSSNWLSTAVFEYHITIMSKLSGAKLSICQEFISNYLSMLHDSTEIQKRSFCHLHYPFHFIVVPNSYWGNWINLQVFNDSVPCTNVIDLVVPHRRYCTAEEIFVGICLRRQSIAMVVKIQHIQEPWRQWIHVNQISDQLLQLVHACGTFPLNLQQMAEAYSYMALITLHTASYFSGLVWFLTSFVLWFGNVFLLISCMENISSRSSALCSGLFSSSESQQTMMWVIVGKTTDLFWCVSITAITCLSPAEKTNLDRLRSPHNSHEHICKHIPVFHLPLSQFSSLHQWD